MMQPKLALATTWAGSIVSSVTWLSHANAVVGILAGLGSLFGLWWFIQAQRAATRLTLAQAKREEHRLCEECLAGKPPKVCPLKNGNPPPAGCPLEFCQAKPDPTLKPT